MTGCPERDRWEMLLLDGLDDGEAASLVAHRASCASCRTVVASLESEASALDAALRQAIPGLDAAGVERVRVTVAGRLARPRGRWQAMPARPRLAAAAVIVVAASVVAGHRAYTSRDGGHADIQAFRDGSGSQLESWCGAGSGAPGEQVPPHGGGGSDEGGVRSPEENIPPPTSGRGSGSDETGRARDPTDPKVDLHAGPPEIGGDAKKNLEDAKKYQAAFNVKSFRRGVNATFAGDYPELQLTFENVDAPRYITIVFYGWSRQGKLFTIDRSYFGPEARITHKLVAAYKKEWVIEHGQLIAGRVEICAGLRKDRAVMVTAECDADKAPKDWWKTTETTDYLGFYRSKTHPFASDTLKRVIKR